MTDFIGKLKTYIAGRRFEKRLLKHEMSLLIVIMLVIIGGFAISTNGRSITASNITNIMLQSSIRGVASIGQMFVILTGGIDLSVGGVACLSGNLCAALLTESEMNIVGAPVSLAIAIPVMLALALGVGAFNGFAVSRIHMPALIVTLAVWEMTLGGVFQLGHGFSFLFLPRSLAPIGHGIIGGLPMPVIIFIATATAAYLVLYSTTFGRSIYAIGGNPVAARLSGLRVTNIIFWGYVICAFLAGIAGLISISRQMVASCYTASGLELDTIAAVCIGGVSLGGGRGTLIGVIIGVMIIGIVNNGMNVIGLSPTLQSLVKGAIIFSAVAAYNIRRR
jgi:ribose/xylose/arabinose/galactoside ABC-type transport system permease subunit